jgi:hypothetical protein
MRLFKPGVVIDVEERDVPRFVRLGFKPFVQERPAVEPEVLEELAILATKEETPKKPRKRKTQ